MSSVYLGFGNSIKVYRKEELTFHERIPSGNYIVCQNEQTGEFYLDKTDDFKPIKKLYGDYQKTINRIIDTFIARPAQTGVLLQGKKGSGKTLVAREVAIRLANEHGIPTIMVNEHYHSTGFKQFIANIDQPCVVLFDEFEKVYKQEYQEKVLTLLDGTIQTKKLFFVTVNDMNKVDNNLVNRPGRMYYSLKYTGLEESFIREYLNDKLSDKEKIENTVIQTLLFTSFSFDMLQALVEEMNRYNEDAAEAIKILNLDPTDGDSAIYNKVFVNAKGYEFKLPWSQQTFTGNPLAANNEYDIDNLYARPTGYTDLKLNDLFNKFDMASDEEKAEIVKNHGINVDEFEIMGECRYFGLHNLSEIKPGCLVFTNDRGESMILTRKKFKSAF